MSRWDTPELEAAMAAVRDGASVNSAARANGVGRARLTRACMLNKIKMPFVRRGRPRKRPDGSPQIVRDNRGDISYGDYTPGPILKACACGKRSHPGAGGRCWTCDNERACRCSNPVPLTSTAQSCKRCGFTIRERRAS